MCDDQNHNEGFAGDFPHLIGRRKFLGLAAGLGVSTFALPAFAMDCVALPWETAGPYPADGTNRKNAQIVNVLTQEGIVRTDLRDSFGEHEGTAQGVPLELEIKLQNADGCKPLTGYTIYVWACDATGKYSLYDFTDQNYLRGLGVSDAKGIVKFTTIFPGCYDGRWPHFHFEVFKDVQSAVSGKASVLTAQIAMPKRECSLVYEQNALYSNGMRNLKRITLGTDNIFADNTPEQVSQQTPLLSGSPEQGYKGRISIPIDLDAERTVKRPPPGGGLLRWFFPW